jgi:hypothetical protein
MFLVFRYLLVFKSLIFLCCELSLLVYLLNFIDLFLEFDNKVQVHF